MKSAKFVSGCAFTVHRWVQQLAGRRQIWQISLSPFAVSFGFPHHFSKQITSKSHKENHETSETIALTLIIAIHHEVCPVARLDPFLHLAMASPSRQQIQKDESKILQRLLRVQRAQIIMPQLCELPLLPLRWNLSTREASERRRR